MAPKILYTDTLPPPHHLFLPPILSSLFFLSSRELPCLTSGSFCQIFLCHFAPQLDFQTWLLPHKLTLPLLFGIKRCSESVFQLEGLKVSHSSQITQTYKVFGCHPWPEQLCCWIKTPLLLYALCV